MTTLIPDGEAVVGSYLRDHPAVAALDARVAANTPSSASRPWVRVTALDAPTRSAPVDHLIEFYFQLDCFAGETATREHRGQAEASELARTVRAALVEMPQADHEDVVVTGAEVRSMARIPDTDFEPARERFALTALVWMHP